MFLSHRFYLLLAAIILITGCGQVYPPLFTLGRTLVVLLCIIVSIDIVLLYHSSKVKAYRNMDTRFSNGDDNSVRLRIENNYPFAVQAKVIDEVPFIFQLRHLEFGLSLKAHEGKTITYKLRPTQRGQYEFGHIRVFVQTPLGLLSRRYTCGQPMAVKVYPSFKHLSHYEFLAISHHLTEQGIKRMHRVGNNTEFEQIKDYVPGDDFRHINWKATARRARLMTNVYQEERAQQIVNLIDKGRTMQQSFNGMTYLDDAINASLALSYIAMKREDKAGLGVFSAQLDTFVPPSRSSSQLHLLLENLYKEHNLLAESDFSALVSHLDRQLNKRSLLILYTNFADMAAMRRQLPYLLQLNRRHRLLVVFFEDCEMKDFITTKSHTVADDYEHVIAEKYLYEQRLIVSTLKQYGIMSLLTQPQQLSVNIINKYLDLKHQGLLT